DGHGPARDDRGRGPQRSPRCRRPPRGRIISAMTSVVIHYGEIALKGRNRPWFIRMLVRSIRTLLADLEVVDTRHVLSRIEVRLGSGADWAEVRGRLARLPGIGNFSPALRVAPDLDAIAAGVMAGIDGLPHTTFRIAARRADKRFPIPSPEV